MDGTSISGFIATAVPALSLTFKGFNTHTGCTCRMGITSGFLNTPDSLGTAILATMITYRQDVAMLWGAKTTLLLWYAAAFVGTTTATFSDGQNHVYGDDVPDSEAGGFFPS